MASSLWATCERWEYVALPLFIFMGEILYRSGISEKLFKSLVPWLYRLPGGLLLMNIISCTLFAAVSGSSAATTATVGRITRIPYSAFFDHDCLCNPCRGFNR